MGYGLRDAMVVGEVGRTECETHRDWDSARRHRPCTVDAMTINATVPILLAWYETVGRRRGPTRIGCAGPSRTTS